MQEPRQTTDASTTEPARLLAVFVVDTTAKELVLPLQPATR